DRKHTRCTHPTHQARTYQLKVQHQPLPRLPPARLLPANLAACNEAVLSISKRASFDRASDGVLVQKHEGRGPLGRTPPFARCKGRGYRPPFLPLLTTR